MKTGRSIREPENGLRWKMRKKFKKWKDRRTEKKFIFFSVDLGELCERILELIPFRLRDGCGQGRFPFQQKREVVG